MKKILFLLGIICLLLSDRAWGYESIYIPAAPPYTYRFDVYAEGEDESVFNLAPDYLMTVIQAAFDLKGLLNVAPISPAKYSIKTIDIFNAYSVSDYVTVEGNNYKITRVNAVLNNKNITTPATELEKNIYDGTIAIGPGISQDVIGWQSYTKKRALYHEALPDLYAISIHEMIHSLGLSSGAKKYENKYGQITYYFSTSINDPLAIHDSYLRIYKGDPAVFDPAKELKPERGMAIDYKNFDIIGYSPYFVGENTLKVLSGKDNAADAKAEIIAKGGLINYSTMYYNVEDPESTVYKTVWGLPIHPSDNPLEGNVDLSHIELRNSLLSHQEFRNWLVPMEAELAYLNDIGYNIDLRKYFGKSYYLNGNDTLEDYELGYSEWDGGVYTGNPSLIDQGVGIHIYGKHNNIRQITNDINTAGNGAVGVRIDGEHNTYTLDSSANILTTGNDSLGIAATWGKDHIVNVSSGSTVSATGADSIAVSFDFGTNFFGKFDDANGSYINFDSETKKNLSPELETQGPLVEAFNTAGTLTGSKAAIYISDNAYVKNININNHSVINGNIISDWNSLFSNNAQVLRKNGYGIWVPVNKDNIDEIYFTNLNFSGTTNVNGIINGSNDIFNTLKMTNTGTLNYSGSDLGVYSLNNSGLINAANPLNLAIQSSQIRGNGSIMFNGVTLNGVNYIENTINIGNSYLNLMDGLKNDVHISKLNSDNAALFIDLGDNFVLQNDSDAGLDQINLNQVAVNSDYAEILDTTEKVKIFGKKDLINPAITLDVNSNTNFYYNKNRYNFSQDDTDKSYLKIEKTLGNFELSDAIADATTANYIVKEDDTFTNDLGTVQGSYFEITGEDIDLKKGALDLNGLVVDGGVNTKTTLKTSIKGAVDSNITLQNNANMVINSNDDEITIGNNDETALTIDNSSMYVEAEKNPVTFAGNIAGLNVNTKNKIFLTGNEINVNAVDNVLISSQVKDLNLNNISTNTVWDVSKGTLNILNDSYLASDGSNQIIANGGALNLLNNRTSDILLSNMTLNSDLNTAIDIDLASLKVDRFLFNNANDLVVNGNDIKISNINILNSKEPFVKEAYIIPFVSEDYNNQNLLNYVDFVPKKEILTPIFKYNLAYREEDLQGNFVLSRGSSSDYRSYNPSVLAASYAAQLGGYFNQLNSYNIGFSNMDMNMLMTKQERTAMKYRNKIAANDVLTYEPNQFIQENKSLWFRPYTMFEKVDVSNGGTVENTSYGSYFGGDSEIVELKNGWDAQYSVYVGYNGSHQNYDSVSIYQNGGQLGVSGYFYKNNFFTGLTASVGASNAQASTMFGDEDFTMLSAGIASKTGYNWELANGKFIIQPNYLMSYSFVNTFNYTNAAGVKVTSKPLNAIQIAPGIKFIGNLKNGWQPYIGISMVWNIMDKTNFRANNVSLPQMSINPYIQYGVGIKKKWKDKFSGFAQAMITNGGRTGVSLTAGFSWQLGK